MTKKLPIIALDHTRWHGSWMNRQHILSRLGKRGWPVLYSNGALYYTDVSYSHLWGTVEDTDNVRVYKSGAFLPRNYKFSWWDKIAVRQHCRDLKKKAGIREGDEFIAFCFHPDFYPYVKELNATYIMFHIYDVFHKFDVTKKKILHIESLVNGASLITASSEVVWADTVENKEISSNIIYNAVDFSLFEQTPYYKDDAFKKIDWLKGPKVAYLGAINRKLDYKLLDRLAILFPLVQFVMIGASGNKENWSDMSQLNSYQNYFNRPNVHHIQSIHRHEIPGCLSLFDVTISPYIMDDTAWAYAAYPLKINEYLAAGKPVVSASSPSMVQHFDEIIDNCHTIDEWANALTKALSGKGKGTYTSRVSFARSNDWDNRLDKLEKLMFDM